MNRTLLHSPASRCATLYPVAFDVIEWEELPALAPALRRSDLFVGAAAWPTTQRMELHPHGSAPAAAPFAEPINGLHVREIGGADVFSHFFGATVTDR